ncbi:DUF2127 domain-containing protein [Ktedonosporobacter rubrisoli]|nr:DUF2127 domain-containing protein [Ktedonosporobacter rubrisoli]
MSETMRQAPRRRPLGVTIISVLVIAGGLISLGFSIVGIVALSAALSMAASLPGNMMSEVISPWLFFLLGLAIVLALADLVLGLGLWMLKSWAYWITIVLHCISLALQVFDWSVFHTSIISLATGVAISVVVVVYLLADREVREAFRV